ncbi:MAG: hypothetical protein K8F33_01675 [Thermomonas sp.]|uniref:hypothetical protein n=1 Tax=Thermomonas sp. TaxID=1971895 RepID=UPI001DBB8F14|nr:hypothetical protein [Thermomonas sp.]MBZ0086798.1 hypothetical protein [Thermomonas sp.]
MTDLGKKAKKSGERWCKPRILTGFSASMQCAGLSCLPTGNQARARHACLSRRLWLSICVRASARAACVCCGLFDVLA